MSDVLLFHHALGLTNGIEAFAAALRRGGHHVVTPDLFGGQRFETIGAGLAHAEQVGFDEMIGLVNRDGTDVATMESLLLTIGNEQFYDMHVKFPAEFGIFMLNLARELSREIEMLEDVIGEGTGWEAKLSA